MTWGRSKTEDLAISHDIIVTYVWTKSNLAEAPIAYGIKKCNEVVFKLQELI